MKIVCNMHLKKQKQAYLLAIYGNQSFKQIAQARKLAEPNTQIRSNYVLPKVVFALTLGQDNGPFISFDIIYLNYISYTLFYKRAE